MPIDEETVLLDAFSRARIEAVELTDRYREAPLNAPYRDALWEDVVRQTETARSLLQRFLREGSEVRDQGSAARLPANAR